MRFAGFFGIAAVTGLFAACSANSTSSSQCMGTATSITVAVIDDTNEPFNVCNATVTIAGPTKATLARSGGQGTCVYEGMVSAGTYMITATSPTYMTATSSVTVQTGCSASTSIDVIPQ